MKISAADLGVNAETVHESLSRWMLADGLPMVVDLDKSQGATMVDAKSGKEYLDFFGCFGSSPIGWNPPALRTPEFLKSCENAVVNKPSNSDLYTQEMARFVTTFAELVAPEGYRHFFFVDGGALAVENALKAAFDWKVLRNRAKGVQADVGQKILHFRHAFHGRSGYTMSLTNTQPEKVAHFPKFDWPRVSSPPLHFPVNDEVLEQVRQAEKQSLAEIDEAFERYGDDIAAIIIEPIQAEGGDRHFRPQFLQALQARCERYDCLFICDEVQTGFFTTGKPWAFQHYGIQPDIVTFGKKTQQCGIMAGPKLDLVPGNVFQTSSRINSTWGGNLVDMMRAAQICQVVSEQDLGENARLQGERWLQGMHAIAEKYPQWVSNVRGLGLMMAFDLPDRESRQKLLWTMIDQGLIGLACGPRSIRFRPHLAIGDQDLDLCLQLTEQSLAKL
ncbi:MAG: L-lysine 6-transaminase [Planctomycetota bacterium]|nr:MAG: L-lysine 6-transaminase [Planctomycetota bacterium]